MSSSRQASLLTPSQRAYLSGETEYDKTDPAGRTTRTRLRTRLYEGLRDFQHLASADELDEDDVDQLRETLANDGILEEALAELVAFSYRLAPDTFPAIIQAGAERGVSRFTPDSEVGEVSVPIHYQGDLVNQARQTMAADEPLTEREIRAVLTHGETDPEVLQEYVRAHPRPRVETYRGRYR